MQKRIDKTKRSVELLRRSGGAGPDCSNPEVVVAITGSSAFKEPRCFKAFLQSSADLRPGSPKAHGTILRTVELSICVCGPNISSEIHSAHTHYCLASTSTKEGGGGIESEKTERMSPDMSKSKQRRRRGTGRDEEADRGVKTHLFQDGCEHLVEDRREHVCGGKSWRNTLQNK
uniref:Uncharacterized protein n=1 Tax=Knipowitschia caucasica TaxID=637954 RepID=A0AAV2JPJ5_KNICA